MAFPRAEILGGAANCVNAKDAGKLVDG
jgi:hypothetical protein